MIVPTEKRNRLQTTGVEWIVRRKDILYTIMIVPTSTVDECIQS